jgi:hypothetical protein
LLTAGAGRPLGGDKHHKYCNKIIDNQTKILLWKKKIGIELCRPWRLLEVWNVGIWEVDFDC